MGSGARIPLHFDSDPKMRKGKKGLAGHGLFLGVNIALKGKNEGSGSFLTSEALWSLRPLRYDAQQLV
ncbi:uncharacterized protein BXZ73DRAFT_98089 [Epithele typhae]|uniref:uncharacterized protein n=1 Tax=Epithele typhae TaxID=378194 RepID=UPI002007610A|nr:uncharacterized protein BXZ73DRAFT_98089 [Epithele typhae]KAH9941698.1 hypothetical protein BXZ73DRAFT_98089 [Epithele typhae]